MNQVPELPEGYFFRVSYAYFGMLRIALRKKLRWGSRSVVSSLAYPNDRSVLQEMDDLKAEAFAPDPCEKYCGDYPPKTLER